MKKISILLLLVLISCKKDAAITKTSGLVFGTYYNVQYVSSTAIDYEKQYDSIFSEINTSMSIYWPTSDISKINNGDANVVIDTHFKKVLKLSKEVHQNTEGFFDPTIGVLVNAWDFGPQGKIVGLDSVKVKELLQYVGLENLIIKNDKIQKPNKTFIDFNAIAKGYALDVVSAFLSEKGYTNYLIDIGGEILAKGVNATTNTPWRIGIENPNFNGTQSYQISVPLHNEAMATSGVYRKFKVDEFGKRYAHIIDVKTGYPSKTNVLSVSVIAPTCALADAYATAFKAMGIKKVTELLKSHPELKVFFIFENEDNAIETLSLNGFSKE